MAEPPSSPRWSPALFGLAGGLGLAALGQALLQGRGDVVLGLVLTSTAILLALLRPLAGRRPWSDAALTAAVGAVALVAWVPGKGPYALGFAAGAACCALLGLVARFLGKKGAVAALLVLGVELGLAHRPVGKALAGSAFPLHVWNQFHYVLGTKYFDECGYFDLYPAILMADAEAQGHFSHVQKVRDMVTYRLLPVDRVLIEARRAGLRGRFTDARWAELQHDVAAFYPAMSERTWRTLFTDLGFNPSPAWLIAHRPLTNAVDIDGKRDLRRLAMLQVPLYLVAGALAWWAFGLRGMLWIAAWTGLFFGNRDRLLGGYFSYDWYVLTVIAVALTARARDALAAPFVAYGGLMRGFPGLLALGPTAAFTEGLLRRRGVDRRAARFLVVLALSMVAVGLASLATPQGAGAWGEWAHKIALQSHAISAGANHIGLETLFGEDWFTPGVQTNFKVRQATVEEQVVALRVTQVVLVAWSLWVMRRRSRTDAMVLGLVPAFALMVLSRYYFAAWVVLLVLGATPEQREGRVPVQVALFALIGSFWVGKALGWGMEALYQTVNAGILVLSVAALAWFSWVDLRARGADPTARPV